MPVKLGMIHSLPAVCHGFGLGGVFGAFEKEKMANLKQNYSTHGAPWH